LPGNDIVLREFKYFDRQIVVDFLSSIEGGLVRESKASFLQKGAQLEGRVGVRGLTSLSHIS
jgi:hypothetical protein